MANIVLVHGWGGSVRKLTPLKRELEREGFNVFIPRLPGFDAEEPKRPFSVQDFAYYVASLADKRFRGKEYFAFGHSFGGRIVTKLAVQGQSNVRGLILVSTSGISRPPFIKRGLFLVLAKTGKAMFTKTKAMGLKRLLYKLAGEHDYERTSGVMRQTFRRIVGESIIKNLESIFVKTLILWGNEDKTTPVRDAYFLKRKLEASSLFVFDNVGHSLPYERPKAVAKIIKKWISS